MIRSAGGSGRRQRGYPPSTAAAIEGLHGREYDRPVRRLHETAALVARLTGEGRVEIDDTPYVENIYTEQTADDLEPLSGPKGERLFVDHADSDRGSKGPFYVVWMDRDREEAYGYFCGNCESLVTSMDSMGGMECASCGNHRKPTRWDAAYM